MPGVSRRCSVRSLAQISPDLEARIREYLEFRKSVPEQDDSSGPKTSGMLDMLGIDPGKESRKRREKLYPASSPAPESPLSYAELRRLGFGDLVDPIMAAGGYLAISRELGISIERRRPPPSPAPVLAADEEIQGGLALGGALDDKLAQASSTRGRKSDPSASSSVEAPRVRGMPEAPQVYTNVGKRARIAIGEEEAEEEEAIIQEFFLLNLAQRGYSLLGASVLAIGWGHATIEAIAAGWMSQTAQEVASNLALVVVVSNVACMAFSIRLAMDKQRSVMIWFLKCFMSGPTALAELFHSPGLGDDTR